MAKFTMKSMPSKRLIASYVFDWICLAAIAAIGAAFNAPGPYKRPFSLVDLSISFPHTEEQISTVTLVVVSLFAPAVLIFLVALIFVPGPTVAPGTPKSLIWKKKLWEWHAGWLGLAMSYAVAFFFTQGMKNIFGRTRPDLLSRCDPDLANYQDHVVGDYARGFSPEWVLVSSSICRQTDSHLLNDGFRSFPSGHSSASWAGLLYLTLFFCSKFSISIPYLAPRAYSAANLEAAVEKRSTLHGSILPLHNDSKHDLSPTLPSSSSRENDIIPLRNQAAAPPTFLLVFPILFISVAIYICSTRYSEYYHHGIDIITGSLIGIITSWVGFRWYHLPAGRGAGWAWGARSRERAFGIGVGRGVYVGMEGWGSKKYGGARGMDTEMDDMGTGDALGRDDYQNHQATGNDHQSTNLGRNDYQSNGHLPHADAGRSEYQNNGMLPHAR